ncbi:peptidase inhibitor family I36 protein [Amycolatopsis sacchari]|uniref:peptidase inhibitor family I36 protein n=1 Tax=Amycolatopsis sacchari TaxID=115433 RepID=UPI003EB7E0B6
MLGKTKLGVLGAATAAVVAGLVGAPAAQASPLVQAAAACPADSICLYTGANATGHMAWFQWGSPNLADQGVDSPAWVISNHPQTMCLYQDPNYGGAITSVSRTVPQGFALTPGWSSVRPC